MKYLYKLMGLIIIFMILITIGLPVVFLGTYQLIDDTDTSIYTRYATDNKYENNIFLNEEVEKSTGIITDLMKNIDGMTTVKSKQDLAKVITKNREQIKTIIDKNGKYEQYLTGQGSSTEEFFEWSKRTAELDDNILQLDLFLICIVYALITVVVFGCRKTFYLIAGIVYALTIMSTVSGGISDYLVINVMNALPKMGAESFSYQDMTTMKTIFIQAYKESMVAFIIFDTIIQIVQNDMDRRRKAEIKYVIYSLDYQINSMRKYENEDYQYVSKLKIPVKTLLKKCRSKQKSIKRSLSKLKDSVSRSRVENEKNNLEKLTNLITEITNFNEARTTKTYIEILTEIRTLIYVFKLHED